MRVAGSHVYVDLLGSVAFTPVKNDMLGNIKVHCARAEASCKLTCVHLESTRQTTHSTVRIHYAAETGHIGIGY